MSNSQIYPMTQIQDHEMIILSTHICFKEKQWIKEQYVHTNYGISHALL